MSDLFGVLILLFILYVVGWFVSFLVLLIGRPKAKLKIAVAHAYAILLLLLSAQLTNEGLALMFYLLCIFNFLAIVVFLFLYVWGIKKNQEPLINRIYRFINPN